MWASAEADCHIIIFCKASIQEACQSQSNCETLCRQYDCVGVHQEDGRNLFLLPLYQRSQTLVQILSKKGNGKTTIWVNFRRKSGSKMGFQVAILCVLKGLVASCLFSQLWMLLHLWDVTFSHISPHVIRIAPIRGWTGCYSLIASPKHFISPSHTRDSVPVEFSKYQHPCRKSCSKYGASKRA